MRTKQPRWPRGIPAGTCKTACLLEKQSIRHTPCAIDNGTWSVPDTFLRPLFFYSFAGWDLAATRAIFSRKKATQPGTCAALSPCSKSGPLNP